MNPPSPGDFYVGHDMRDSLTARVSDRMPALQAWGVLLKGLLVLAVVSNGIAGCASVLTEDYWTYRGNDLALQSPPRVARGDLSAEAWMAKLQESKDIWWRARNLAHNQAKEACAQETGKRMEPGFWFGHSSEIVKCMKARGWSEGRSPL